MRPSALASAVLLATLAGAAQAQVDCSNPDNLCTGDPCVIPSAEVASPCTADFGGRMVIVQGTLVVPGDGLLSLSAGTFSVVGTIDGRGTGAQGADLTLSASGNIDVAGRMTAGGSYGGTITLQADGNIALDGPLQAPGLGNTGGGTITVEAGGTLAVRTSVHVKSRAGGGQIALRGAAGVTVEGPVLAKGLFAGSVEVSSSAGDVIIDSIVSSAARFGDGGPLTVSAQGNVLVNGKLDAKGGASGGTLSISTATGDITVVGSLEARGRRYLGGTVIAAAAGNATVMGKVIARSLGPSLIDFSAGGMLSVASTVSMDARGFVGTIGIINPPPNAGTGGVIRLVAASGQVDPGAKLVADGELVGGTVELAATAGNLLLGGDFRARGGGGVIEGTATGDLTADGDFEAAPGGCIGLSAGGTLDISAGEFDEPVLASCP